MPTPDLFCLAFAPDGATLATGGFAGAVGVWDVATGDLGRRSSLGISRFIPSPSLPTGRRSRPASRERGPGSGTSSNGTKHSSLTGKRSSRPALLPDGRLMAVKMLGGEIVVWERATGKRRLTAQGHAVAFAPDSRSLAMSGPDGGTLRVLDTESGSELWKTDLGWGLRSAGAAFSPDGKTIITERGGVLRFFEAGQDASGSRPPRLTRVA